MRISDWSSDVCSSDLDDLPPLGLPGREVSRQAIEDVGVTIVRFDNGSTLTFKQTDFEKGSVLVQLRFGHGHAGFPADQPSLAWLDGIVSASGDRKSTRLNSSH